jgi:hypothetical protein
MELSLSAILTSSGKGFSLHLLHRLAPMHLTEASLASSSAAICLLSIPQTTRFITSRSRTLNLFWRCRSSAMSRCFSRTMRSRVSDRCAASSKTCCLGLERQVYEHLSILASIPTVRIVMLGDPEMHRLQMAACFLHDRGLGHVHLTTDLGKLIAEPLISTRSVSEYSTVNR